VNAATIATIPIARNGLMTDKPDPFDVEALGNAVNDSATRVSTIWISFLIFALYLLTAATTVTHRQLLLAEPLKLPVLNIDLPLWGFFFLAPILFVIFHVYVLLQVLLLAHTAAAYNATVAQMGFDAKESAALRQRLANTLFAQVFAGAPREREGWIGWMLRAMAWTTLAVAPILILVVFQFAFLPYHSHLATWAHRLLILLELVAAFVLWPLVLDSERDFDWSRISAMLKQAITLPPRLFGPKDGRRDASILLRQQAVSLTAFASFAFVSLSWATFPGEPHLNLFTGRLAAGWPPLSVECKNRWLQKKFSLIDLRFDRLVVPHVDAIDQEKLEKIKKATTEAGKGPYEGERTRILRDRDLNCADISDFADLRRVDLTGSSLQGASLDDAQLQGASLLAAQLQGASLDNARLQGALLSDAQLQGASLIDAQLQGASLDGALLQGASLDGALLQGASLNRAQLQGASLDNAQLQGADLSGARVQGASLIHAQLQGASLDGALLQGTDLRNSSMKFARVSSAYVWRARNADCQGARVRSHTPAPIVGFMDSAGRKSINAEPNEIAKFIAGSVADIPDGKSKEAARPRMQAGLDPAKDDTAAIEAVWSECERESSSEEFDRKFDHDHAEFLRELVCEDFPTSEEVASGIASNWVPDARDIEYDRRDFTVQLAKGLLGQDGSVCAAATVLGELWKKNLLAVIATAPKASSPAAATAPPPTK
jgi:uncharacterized protein YjbI with pentapeptide repeats